jgi:hypothetical protein
MSSEAAFFDRKPDVEVFGIVEAPLHRVLGVV